MKIYVSAGSTEVDRAATFMADLRVLGHDITHDWTVSVRAFQAGGDVDPYHAATADIVGVHAADVLIALVPREPSKGLWVEIGAALATAIPVCVVGPVGCADIWGEICGHAFGEVGAVLWLGDYE